MKWKIIEVNGHWVAKHPFDVMQDWQEPTFEKILSYVIGQINAT